MVGLQMGNPSEPEIRLVPSLTWRGLGRIWSVIARRKSRDYDSNTISPAACPRISRQTLAMAAKRTVRLFRKSIAGQ